MPIQLLDELSTLGGLIAIFNISFLINYCHQKKYEEELEKEKKEINVSTSINEIKEKITFIEFCRIIKMTNQLNETTEQLRQENKSLTKRI